MVDLTEKLVSQRMSEHQSSVDQQINGFKKLHFLEGTFKEFEERLDQCYGFFKGKDHESRIEQVKNEIQQIEEIRYIGRLKKNSRVVFEMYSKYTDIMRELDFFKVKILSYLQDTPKDGSDQSTENIEDRLESRLEKELYLYDKEREYLLWNKDLNVQVNRIKDLIDSCKLDEISTVIKEQKFIHQRVNRIEVDHERVTHSQTLVKFAPDVEENKRKMIRTSGMLKGKVGNKDSILQKAQSEKLFKVEMTTMKDKLLELQTTVEMMEEKQIELHSEIKSLKSGNFSMGEQMKMLNVRIDVQSENWKQSTDQFQKMKEDIGKLPEEHNKIVKHIDLVESKIQEEQHEMKTVMDGKITRLGQTLHQNGIKPKKISNEHLEAMKFKTMPRKGQLSL